jgi:gluconolactonase
LRTSAEKKQGDVIRIHRRFLVEKAPPRGYAARTRPIAVLFAEVAMRVLSLLSLLLAACTVSAADVPRPTGERIVSPDAKLELLFTRSAPIHGGLTEGPAVAPDGSIYFSDIPFGKDKGMILHFDPKTKKTEVFTDDSHKSNGLKFDAKGYLIACEGSDEGGRCVSRWDVKTKMRTVIADRYQDKRFNAPNDLAIDKRGRIYFTDPRYLGDEKRELEYRAVYRIGPADKVIEITHELEKPNGIALSPDNRLLYVADHNNGTDRIDPTAPAPKPGAMKIYRFTLDADGKVKGSGKELIDFGTEAGCDGMTVDVEGNVYLAVRSLKRPGILVIDPDGKEIAFIPTGPSQPGAKEPVGIPSNCCFGLGAESKTLYVTVDVSLYRIPLKVEGYHVPFEK